METPSLGGPGRFSNVRTAATKAGGHLQHSWVNVQHRRPKLVHQVSDRPIGRQDEGPRLGLLGDLLLQLWDHLGAGDRPSVAVMEGVGGARVGDITHLAERDLPSLGAADGAIVPGCQAGEEAPGNKETNSKTPQNVTLSRADL